MAAPGTRARPCLFDEADPPLVEFVKRTRPCLFDEADPALVIFESPKTRRRPDLFQEPEYKPPAYKGSAFEGWARKYIKSHLWRAQAFIDQEDLEQDAGVKYWVICRRYGPSLKNGAHLMRLFQVAITNMLTSEARKTKCRIKTIATEDQLISVLKEQEHHGI